MSIVRFWVELASCTQHVGDSWCSRSRGNHVGSGPDGFRRPPLIRLVTNQQPGTAYRHYSHFHMPRSFNAGRQARTLRAHKSSLSRPESDLRPCHPAAHSLACFAALWVALGRAEGNINPFLRVRGQPRTLPSGWSVCRLRLQAFGTLSAKQIQAISEARVGLLFLSSSCIACSACAICFVGYLL